MSLGTAVDYCVEWNNRQDRAERQAKAAAEKGARRKATQSDIDSFCG